MGTEATLRKALKHEIGKSPAQYRRLGETQHRGTTSGMIPSKLGENSVENHPDRTLQLHRDEAAASESPYRYAAG